MPCHRQPGRNIREWADPRWQRALVGLGAKRIWRYGFCTTQPESWLGSQDQGPTPYRRGTRSRGTSKRDQDASHWSGPDSGEIGIYKEVK